MSSKLQHRGVLYSVKELVEQRWRWEVHPPSCVVGMREEAGEIAGVQADAVQAARRAIESQVGLH